jgi:cytoskeletal protein RodZ
MSSVAEQLRSARATNNLTIEQVAEMTKIRTDYIRALEEGNFDVFSAPIYIRGSVKNYATTLKLDVPSLLALLDTELGRTKNFSEPPPLTEQKKTIVDHFTLLMAKLNWKIGFAGLVIVLVAIVGTLILLAMKHQKPADPAKNIAPARVDSPQSGNKLPLPKR